MRVVFSDVEPGRVELIALRAGRGGDDAFLIIDRSNPQLEEIHDLLSTMRFAGNNEPIEPQDRGEIRRWLATQRRHQPPRKPHADRCDHRRA